MRTIRVEVTLPDESGSSTKLSTEVIVEDGEERQAGTDAADALWEFVQGYDQGGANR